MAEQHRCTLCNSSTDIMNANQSTTENPEQISLVFHMLLYTLRGMYTIVINLKRIVPPGRNQRSQTPHPSLLVRI